MQATATVQADNERTTVTEWRFQPGQSTGYHRHAYDYVIVPLTTGKLQLTGPDRRAHGEVAGAQHLGVEPQTGGEVWHIDHGVPTPRTVEAGGDRRPG